MAFVCPQSTVDKLEKEKMPRKGGRWWFSWRRRDFPAEEVGGHGPGVGSARAGAGRSLDVLPAEKCPEGEDRSPGGTGVSGSLGWGWGGGLLEGRSGADTPPPAVVLCRSLITPTPFLSPEKCPHFTDGKTEAWR